jgi:hypothetical protein
MATRLAMTFWARSSSPAMMNASIASRRFRIVPSASPSLARMVARK